MRNKVRVTDDNRHMSISRSSPADVRFLNNRLNDLGQLEFRVETSDLGNDNAAGVRVSDAQGHAQNIELNWVGKRPHQRDEFVGFVEVDALKRLGFDMSSLKEAPYVRFARGSRVFWGTAATYDAKRYRDQVDDHIWRGSSINSSDDLDELLAHQKPRLVVVLRETRETKYNDDEGLFARANRDRLLAEQVAVVRIPIRDFHTPTLDQVRQFLDLVTDPVRQPAYVHCRAGVGRTGVMIAAYRMAVHGWSADEALAEAKRYGLADDSQIRFIEAFPARLQAGDVPGYPR